MYFINNMKIEKIILIGIIIILSILIIRYFTNSNYFENFENNEEYGIIHMTKAKVSDYNLHKEDKINYIWSNHIKSYKNPNIPKILISSLPPGNFNFTKNEITNIILSRSTTNNKLNTLLPDTRFIGSSIYLNKDNVNQIEDDKTPFVLRCNNSDNISIYGSGANNPSFHNLSNYEFIGNLGSIDDNLIITIDGMNIGFPDVKTGTINKMKAIDKKPILEKIVKDEPNIEDASFIGVVERMLLKELIGLESNDLENEFRNKIRLSIPNLDDNKLLVDDILINNDYKKFYRQNYYDDCSNHANSTNCKKKIIYDKLFDIIINDGYYEKMPFNIKGGIKIINDLADKIKNLKLYKSDIKDDILFSEVYKGSNITLINSNNVQGRVIPFRNSEISYYLPESTEILYFMSATIPIGSEIRFHMQNNRNDNYQSYAIKFSRDKLKYLIENFTDIQDAQNIFIDYGSEIFSFSKEPENHEDKYLRQSDFFLGRIILKRNNLNTNRHSDNYNSWDSGQLFYLQINNIPIKLDGDRVRKITIKPEENIIQKIKDYDGFISSYNKNNFINETDKIYIQTSDVKGDIKKAITTKPFMFLPQHKLSYTYYINRLRIYRALKHIAKYFIHIDEKYVLHNQNYNSLNNKIKKFIYFIDKIDDTQINFYKIKNNKIPDKHISLGDIAILNKFNNTSRLKILKKFTTIPIHCFKEIRDWEETDKIFEQQEPYLAIFKNNYTNTFKVVNKKNTLPEGKVGMILPCPDHDYHIDNLIDDNNKAILKCRKYNNMKQNNPLLTYSAKDDPINVNLNKKIYNQEKKITMLKEYADRLREENNKGVIINREYNRSRLNNYLQNQKNSLDNAVDKLIDSNNKVDININYKIQLLDKITDYIIEASNQEIPFEKKKVLVKKVQDVKKMSLHGDNAEEKIEEILQECPTFNMEGYFKRDPPCLGCTIPRDQE